MLAAATGGKGISLGLPGAETGSGRPFFSNGRKKLLSWQWSIRGSGKKMLAASRLNDSSVQAFRLHHQTFVERASSDLSRCG
jgi:hypothetical protein